MIIKISLILKNLCKSVIICGQKIICDNPINNYICGNLWIKRVGGREMLKASGGNVKCLGKGEKS